MAADHVSTDGLLAGEERRPPGALLKLSADVGEIRDRLRHDPRLRLDELDDAREQAEGETWAPMFEADGAVQLDDRLLDVESTRPKELQWSQLRVGAKATDAFTAEADEADGSALAVIVRPTVAAAVVCEEEKEGQQQQEETAVSAAVGGDTPPVVERASHALDFKVAAVLQPTAPEPTTVVPLPAVTLVPFKISLAKTPVRVWNLKASLVGAIVALAIVVGLAVGLARDVPTVREHFLAIEEAEWDYAPANQDLCHGTTAPKSDFSYKSKKIMEGSPSGRRIGRKYMKARFVEYTDVSFTTKLTTRTDASAFAHLGFLGPVLRAEVGERLRVTLRNNARFSFSLHARGAYGDKRNEGVGYNDGSFWFKKKDDAIEPFGLGAKTCRKKDFLSPKQIERRRRRLLAASASSESPAWKDTPVNKDAIPPKAHPDEDSCSVYEVLPGENRVYSWLVREADGPGPADGDSTLWLYQSHVGGQGAAIHAGGLGLGDDVNAGLLGPILVTKKGASVNKDKVYPAGHVLAGKLDPSGLTPASLDKEFVTIMSVTDENASPYLKANVYKYIEQPLFTPATPGYVAFGTLDRARVLMKLYESASHGSSKLSYADADTRYKTANTANTWLDAVNGYKIKVWFNSDAFDPAKYDAMYGANRAQDVVDALKHDLVDYLDPQFIESNMMHGINGLTHCNLPSLALETGDKTRWYVASVGSHGDMHSPHWHGNTGVISGGDAVDGGARADIFELIAGGTRTFDMHAENPGEWLYHCHVNDHIQAGMNAKYTVTRAAGAAALTASNVRAQLKLTTPAVEREYWVQAEEVQWDYTADTNPDVGTLATDTCSGLPLDTVRGRTVTQAPDRIGTIYTKARYVRYTDSTYSTAHAAPAGEEHLGILGPLLRAEVGDSIKVHFRNKGTNSKNYSMHPHGVFYLKEHEGAPYNDGNAAQPGDSVAPGASHTYVWQVPESAGPAATDPSSIVWMYHSHVSEVNNTNAGLVGPIIVTKKGMASSATDAAPKDVDREFVLLAAVLDENKADFYRENQAKMSSFAGNGAITGSFTADMAENLKYRQLKDAWYKGSNKMHSLNGKVFCGLSGLSFKDTDRTRMHLMSLGDESSHVPIFEGQTFVDHGHRTAAPGMMSASMRSLDIAARGGGKYAQPGTWMVHDGVLPHLQHGLKAAFAVSRTGAAPALLSSGSGATYNIAADEVEWDYAPSGRDLCADAPHAEVVRDTDGAQRAAGFERDTIYQGHHRIGSKYIKARYRQYTSTKFSKLSFGQRSRFNAISEHLGLQGPVLQGMEGDILTVHFKNKLRFPCNFVVGGGVVSRGASDPTDVVAPGATATYVLELTAASAPEPSTAANEKSAAVYPYTSSIDHAVHQRATGAARASAASVANFAGFDAGLFGVLIVARKGASAFPGSEIATVFATIDENKSPYLDMNINKYAGSGATVDKRDPAFKDSNRMASINGRMHCNLGGLVLLKNKSTRWYQVVLGSDADIHAPTLYGQALDVWGHHVAATEVFPGQGVVADFKPSYAGAWLMQSATVSAAQAGMQAMLQVADRVA